ncbi:MAG: BspA family leucine-rich repeat surface protein [Bdellovibrionales bacterium]|nr:BspA family leucine-rich repeat surface protein [Bdellovibrionales bacterium]
MSVWKTDADNQSITLPLRSGYNYDFTVDWGDESVIDHITSSSDPLATHTYEKEGTYEVTIKGLLESWYFNNTGDKDYIIEVKNLGDVGWVNLEQAFNGCEQLTSFAGGNTSEVTNMKGMFGAAISLSSLDVSSFDTSKVTDMSGMFSFLWGLSAVDVTNFDTSMVTDMAYMFYSIPSLSSLNVSNFDTSKVTNMSNMFSSMFSLLMLNLSNFDTSMVTDMTGMFSQDTGLVSLNLNGWDVTNVTQNNNVFSSIGSSVMGGTTLYCDQSGGSLFGLSCN